MKKRWIIISLLTVLTAILMAACTPPEPQTVVVTEVIEVAGEEVVVTQIVEVPAEPAEPVFVRIGYGSDPDFPQVVNFYWEELLAEEYGYEVEHYFFDSTQTAYKAMLAGAVDVVATGVLPAIQVSLQTPDNPLLLVAADMQAPDYILVTTQEIQSLQDLEGKRLGISTPGDISDTLSRATLQREGIDLNTVQIIQIGGTGARMAALVAGEIDAGMAHADSALVAASNGLNPLYAVGNTTQGYLQHGLIAPKLWLEANPDRAQNVVNAFMDSVRWAAANKEEYIDYSLNYLDVPREILSEAYDIFTEVNLYAVDGGLSEENLATTMELEVEAGNLEESVPYDIWVDTTYVDAYLAENGRIGD